MNISCHQHSDNSELAIAVTDTGIGITSDALPHIYEPFFTTKQDGHGVGLGLSTAYGIIEKHNGRIEVQSRVDQGTTFTIWMPVRTENGP